MGVPQSSLLQLLTVVNKTALLKKKNKKNHTHSQVMDAEHVEAWNSLISQSHEAQAIWFLNAFWNGGVKEKAEDIWNWQEKFKNIDPSGGTGNDHDEFWSHKYLEDMGETVTVLELRKKRQKHSIIVSKHLTTRKKPKLPLPPPLKYSMPKNELTMINAQNWTGYPAMVA